MLKQEQISIADWIKKGAITFVLIGLLIVSFVINKLNNSDASKVAKEYIKANEEIRVSIGEVEGFGWASTGNIQESQEGGQAELSFEITGTKKKTNLRIYLTKNDSGWKVDKYKLE